MASVAYFSHNASPRVAVFDLTYQVKAYDRFDLKFYRTSTGAHLGTETHADRSNTVYQFEVGVGNYGKDSTVHVYAYINGVQYYVGSDSDPT